jgi:hypothetical protein
MFNGCARWPEEPNGGNGNGQSLLRVRVDINENGTINTEEGNYYIVFDTDVDAPFGPSDDIEDWESGYYYIRLDSIGFFFGEVLDNGTSEQLINGIGGSDSDDYFEVTLSLADLENPEGIYMNVITTDLDNNTYDALDPDFYIETDLIFPTTETDFPSDSAGGADFDITQVTATILVP